jgi:hypothetical protein
LKGLIVSLLLMVGALGLAYWLLRELVVEPSLEPQISEFSSTQDIYSVSDGNSIRLNWTIQNPRQDDELVITVYTETGESLPETKFKLNELSMGNSSRCNTSIHLPPTHVQLLRRLYRHAAEQTSLSCLGMGLEDSEQPLQLLPGNYQVQLQLFEEAPSKDESEAEKSDSQQKRLSPRSLIPSWVKNRFGNFRGVADSRYEPIAVAIGTSLKCLQSHTAIQQRHFRLPFTCQQDDEAAPKTAIATQRLERVQITPALPAEIVSFTAQNQAYRWVAENTRRAGSTDSYSASPIRLAWSIRYPTTVTAIEILYDHANYTGQVISNRISYPVQDGWVEGLGESCILEANQLVCRTVPIPTEAPGLYTVTLVLITDNLQTQQRIAQTLEPIEVRPPLPQILSFTVNNQDVQTVPHQYFEVDPEQEPVDISLAWSVANPDWMQIELLPAPGQVPVDSNSLAHTLAPLAGTLSFTLQVTNPAGEKVSRSVVIETSVLEPEPLPPPVLPDAYAVPAPAGVPSSIPSPKPGPVFNLPPFQEPAPTPEIQKP